LRTVLEVGLLNREIAMTWTRLKIGALGALGMLAGCSGGGGGDDGGTGTISLAIMDAPVHDATAVVVTFTGVSLKPQGDGPAIDINFQQPKQLDLLTLTADNAATLLEDYPVPAGHYNWLELHVDAKHDGDAFDSYAKTLSGGQEEIELEVPSGRLRLVSGLTITANQETSFLIDWNLHKGLNHPVGQPGFFLRPALRIIDMTQFGTLAGTVNSALITAGCGVADLAIGNSVYIYDASPIVNPLDPFDPFDFDAADPEPIATTAVTQSPAGPYVYETLLSPGSYWVAFTCQAENDLPNTPEDIAFVAAPASFTIAHGQTMTINF